MPRILAQKMFLYSFFWTKIVRIKLWHLEVQVTDHSKFVMSSLTHTFPIWKEMGIIWKCLAFKFCWTLSRTLPISWFWVTTHSPLQPGKTRQTQPRSPICNLDLASHAKGISSADKPTRSRHNSLNTPAANMVHAIRLQSTELQPTQCSAIQGISVCPLVTLPPISWSLQKLQQLIFFSKWLVSLGVLAGRRGLHTCPMGGLQTNAGKPNYFRCFLANPLAAPLQSEGFSYKANNYFLMPRVGHAGIPSLRFA